jgi:hypothetical protein
MNDNAHQYQGYQVLQLRQLLIFMKIIIHIEFGYRFFTFMGSKEDYAYFDGFLNEGDEY